MMECDHDILKNIREYYISQIVTQNSAMAILPSDLFFKYCILCIDMKIKIKKNLYLLSNNSQLTLAQVCYFST